MQDRVSRDFSLSIDGDRQDSSYLRTDIRDYINEGQRLLGQALVAEVKEDYFLREHPIVCEAGVTDYSLPPSIFINKLRGVLYGTKEQYSLLEYMDFSQYLRGISTNTSGGTRPFGYYLSETENIDYKVDKTLKTRVKLALVPKGIDCSGYRMRVFYIRMTTDMIESDDTPDIVASDDALIAYAKYKVCLIDPTRNLEAHQLDWHEKRQMVLESYTDKTPSEWGRDLMVDSFTESISIAPGELY